MAKIVKLTHEEFELCRPFLYRISKERQDIAYKILVMGIPPTVISNEYDISRQLLNQLITNVLKKMDKLKPEEEDVSTPHGWVKSTFFAPAAVILKLKKLYDEEMNVQS